MTPDPIFRSGGWARHLFYRTEVVRPTWKLRLGVLLLLVLTPTLTRGLWIPAIADSLVCDERSVRPEALLLDNLDADYLLFERATTLRRYDPDLPVFVPVTALADGQLKRVQKETTVLLARVARLGEWEAVPFAEVEPISLNVAYRVRDRLQEKGIRSVAIVSPAFRSRRSTLVYEHVLAEAGIEPSCIPVFDTKDSSNWADTWHGVQDVGLQFLKLQYYRFWILPREP